MDDVGADKVVNFSTKAVAEPTILWFESCSKGAQKIGEEVGRFMISHTRRNMEAWIALTQSPTPTTFIETQQRWLKETVHECTEESKRLMEMSSSMAAEFLSKVEHRE